jgi:hypothetical protein
MGKRSTVSTVGGPDAAKGWDYTAEWSAGVTHKPCFKYKAARLSTKINKVMSAVSIGFQPVVRYGNAYYPIPQDVFYKTMRGLLAINQKRPWTEGEARVVGGFARYFLARVKIDSRRKLKSDIVISQTSWKILKEMGQRDAET